MRTVQGDTLVTYEGEPSVVVGTAAWFAWLETAATFSFVSAAGHFTARREQAGHKRGSWYWKAYRKQHGKLTSHYLGKAATLSLARLEAVAQTLATKAGKTREERGADPLNPLRPGEVLGRVGSPLDLLLTTKLHHPRLRTPFVVRPHLVARLQAGMASALTLVSAPAGFGKTTLLTQWITATSLPVAWLTLEPADNEPTRFLTYLIAALQTLLPQSGALALTLLQTAQPVPPEAVLTALSNELMHYPTGDLILVLDDYYVIDAPPIHRGVAFLLEHLPPCLHLVLATRADPPLPLVRLRARGQLCEVRATELRFDATEANTFLQTVMGLDLLPATISAVQERTEGWVTGLQLAALSLQGRADVPGFLNAFTGSHRFVLDYLSEEVLAQQSAAVQAFLLQTALLKQLTGALCDAVMEQADSQVMLETLEQAHLFIVALDEERRWYRYHPLFAEVLRSRLRQRQPTLIPALHQRASLWYEAHALLEEAVQHALAVPDWARAAHLIEQDGWSLVRQGQTQTLRGWLDTLPDAVVRRHPLLSVYHALVLFAAQQFASAESRLQDAERGLQAGIADEATYLVTQGWLALTRSSHTAYMGDLVGSIAFAQQALDVLPATEGRTRAAATMNLTQAYLVNGDVTPTMARSLGAVVAPARATGNPFVFLRSLTNLARLQVLQGQLCQATATYAQVEVVTPEQAGLRVRLSGAGYYFGLGELLRERNELKAAEALLLEGMQIVQETLLIAADVVALGFTALARLHQARGAYADAQATVDAFLQVAQQRHFFPLLVAQVVAVRAPVELAAGNLAAAVRWADSTGSWTADESLYLREREYLALARVRIAQGRAHPAGPFLEHALDLLARLLADAEPKARLGSVLEIRLLQALALATQGNQPAALRLLAQVLRFAAPEDYVRLFLDEGPAMLALLRAAQAQGIAPTYIATLLTASGEPSGPVPTPAANALIEPLTERESAVLHLLVAGLSNAAIARALVVTTGTVKSHVNHIYGKLGVSSRTQAIARAHALHLSSLP